MRMTDEQRKLVEQNHNLIYDFLYKNELNIEEYYDIAAIGLCNAAIKYDSKKGKFSTLAFKCMKSEVNHHFSYINRKKRIPPSHIYSYDILLSVDEGEYNPYINTIFDGNFDTYEIVEKSISYANFSKELDDREKFIIKCFESGLTQKEIGIKLNISQQAVYQRIKKMRNKWNKFKNK